MGGCLALLIIAAGAASATEGLQIIPMHNSFSPGPFPYNFTGNYPVEREGYAPLGLVSAVRHPERIGVAYGAALPTAVEAAEVKYISRPAVPPDAFGIMCLSSVLNTLSFLQ